MTREERERLKRLVDRGDRARIGVDSRGRMLGASAQSGALARAEAFLRDALEDGARPRAELVAEAAAVGITESALCAVKKRLGIEHARAGPGRTTWRLPAHREGE